MAQPNHRKQLAKYLTEKKESPSSSGRHARSPAAKKVPIVQRAPPKGKTSIFDVPNEIILKIFGYLTMGDLLSVAQVCHLWHQLSSDNLLWKPLLRKSVPAQLQNQQPTDLKTANLKSSFMQRCIEMRNKRILKYLKKKNPYTGIIHCKDVESALKYAGTSWQLVLTDTSGNEHRLHHQDVTFHLLSVSVRWYSLTMIPVSSVKSVSIYSCNPLFYESSSGKVISNGPYKRSLMVSMETKLSTVIDKLKPVGADDHLKVYSLDNHLVIGIWKEGGEIAFITSSFSLPGLVKRCIMGNASEFYQPPEDQISIGLSESSYGLYGYSCTVQLRTMKQEVWDYQFSNVECPNCNIRGNFAHFDLLKESDRQILQKEVVFPWKTDAFKGKVKDVCYVDMVLVNNDGRVVWFYSSAVSVKKDGTRAKLTYGMGFDYCREMSRCIEFSDGSNKGYIQIDQDDERTYITQVSLDVAMETLMGKESKAPESSNGLQVSSRALSTQS